MFLKTKEKWFIQLGRFSSFLMYYCQNPIQKQLSAVRLGQKVFQAVGPGSNLSRARSFYELADTFQNFQLLSWHSE